MYIYIYTYIYIYILYILCIICISFDVLFMILFAMMFTRRRFYEMFMFLILLINPRKYLNICLFKVSNRNIRKRREI